MVEKIESELPYVRLFKETRLRLTLSQRPIARFWTRKLTASHQAKTSTLLFCCKSYWKFVQTSS